MAAAGPDHIRSRYPDGSRETAGAAKDTRARTPTGEPLARPVVQSLPDDVWLSTGAEDDLRPRMREARDRGEPFVLATLAAADGGPRPVGSQMVITAGASSGFVSGGCVEADVRLHALDTLADGRFREVIYGKGSPFADIRLPCGGSLTVRMERIAPGDPVLDSLLPAPEARRSLVYFSDGARRGTCAEGEAASVGQLIIKRYTPPQRLIVVGADPFALSMAALARTIGWDVTLVRPKGPAVPPPLDVDYRTDSVVEALVALSPDVWTAVAIATHDTDLDDDAVISALGGAAGYVGVLGSRRRVEDRRDRLAARGVQVSSLDRVRAPIGLAIGASSPWEVAIAVLAEIIADKRA